MNSGFECDFKDFEKLVVRLTGKEMKLARKKALRKGSSILVRGTRKELRSAGFKFRRWMDKAVKYKVHRSANSSTVHLFGDIRETGKDRGIVRYLEVGTDERYRSIKYMYRGKRRIKRVIIGRKKGYSGRIKGYDFFANARDNSAIQVQNVMNTTLDFEIRKISFLK
ncbi:hypothetical protein H8784_15735 [Parabacteroides acidifaciens]|uniref:Phage morphogenesis protein n=1 Tax=Parabacteroides acidifaciens TaxID=2290935 RepID=A0A3D8HAV0_9BACT|nr:hypothetical protein [Parabacteroides acidifaciens]MBC8603162.1 hypothetical protein [Parabacteroides acidifaciens]RDU48094.1 hypothetical protein DWU89_16125 [Parabacteroides acidifaciens]